MAGSSTRQLKTFIPKLVLGRRWTLSVEASLVKSRSTLGTIHYTYSHKNVTSHPVGVGP